MCHLSEPTQSQSVACRAHWLIVNWKGVGERGGGGGGAGSIILKNATNNVFPLAKNEIKSKSKK